MPYKFIYLKEYVKVPAIMPIDEFNENFFNKLSIYLKEIGYIHNIKIKSNRLIFKAPPFRFAWNGWNLFNPVSNGHIQVFKIAQKFIIEYKIYFWEFFIYSLLFSTVAIYGFFPNIFFRTVYLLIVWTFFIFHSLWVKNRLEKLLKTLAEQVSQEYLDRLRTYQGEGEG